MSLNWCLKRYATKLKNFFRLESAALKILLLTLIFFLTLVMNYYLLAFFVLVTFIWLLLFRKNSICCLLILFFLYFFFSSNFFDTLYRVHEIFISIYSGDLTYFDNIVKTETDISVIPSIPIEINYMKNLIDKHSLDNYNLSIKIRNDSLLFQRAIEVNWPVKLEIFSNHLFILDGESREYEKCQKVDQLEEVILVYCP